MRFRSHLIAGLTASVLITTVAAAISIVALRLTARSTDRVARQFADNMVLVQTVWVKAEHLVASSRGLLLTGEPSQRARFKTAEAEFERSLQQLALRALQVHTATEVETIAEVADAYVRAVRHASRLRAATGDPRAILAYFDEELRPRREAFESTVEGFVREERRLFDRAVDRAQHLASAAQQTVLVTSAIGVAIGLLLAYFVIRHLSGQLRQIAAATEQANRAAAARKEILAVVSHDLRNPLNTVSLSASMLSERDSLPHGERRGVEIIRNAAERMRHLIDDLVESSELDAKPLVLHRTSCNLGSLLDGTVDLFCQRAAAKDVNLMARCQPELVATVDRERIHQILANLIGNSLKFARPGDSITVSGAPSGSGVRIEVADTGPGIAKDQLPHLFEPYWQGDRRSEKGSVGLGLYICQKLVAAHGGEIGVSSAPGRGTTFWFELPTT